MAMRPEILLTGSSSLAQSSETNSPSEQRDDVKRNLYKTLRPFPTQHYWVVYVDIPSKDQTPQGGDYKKRFQPLGKAVDSVQAFWRYYNNTPITQLKLRESIFFFKQGIFPVWEDRRNVNGGSWTFRIPKGKTSEEVWKLVQVEAVGEYLQSALAEGDQICGVGLSVRFSANLVTVWHRDSSKKKSIDGIAKYIAEVIAHEHVVRIPVCDEDGKEIQEGNCFYKRHRDHSGFKAPPEQSGNLPSHQDQAPSPVTASGQPIVTVDPPSK